MTVRSKWEYPTAVMGDERLRELMAKRDSAGLSSAEASELGELLGRLPRRPDRPISAADVWTKPGKPWERGWAIVGVVLAFPFFLTIPGWIGLDHYHKWQRRERPRPTGFIVWGIFMTGWIVVFVVVLAATRG